jgi:NAD(P)H-dependent flavin oxidoreductase YrpB (nitropropane dioxygenase family)
MKTRFTELVGCPLPLQLATLGGVGSLALTGAVAATGGLGMIPHALLAPEFDALPGVRGISFTRPDRSLAAEVAEAARRARVVEFFWAEPDAELVNAAHQGGALVAWQVGSADEAVAAERAGVDLVVAQGVEAGGHVRGTVGLMPLLAAVLDAVQVPVVAAGGIAHPRTVAGVLAAGADAVRVGTAFVATDESNAHDEYKQALLFAKAEDTQFTEAFGGGWPNAPHRVLRSAYQAAREADPAAEGQWSSAPPSRAYEGDPRRAALYAGQGVGHVTAIRPAAEVAAWLMSKLPAEA